MRMKSRLRFTCIGLSIVLLLSGFAPARAAEPAGDKPLCTIAAISTPYISTLSAAELGKRSFLERAAPAGLERTIEAVNGLKPDAMVILGSLTWTGSEADFQRFQEFADRIEVPLYLVPGDQDLADGGASRFATMFEKSNVAGKSIDIKGAHLQFAYPPVGETADEAKLLEQMEAGLAQSDQAKAVLLFGGLNYSPPADGATAPPAVVRYWKALEQHHVAARFVAEHSHSVRYDKSLPIWTVPSSSWTSTPNWRLAIITVYPKQIELALLLDDDQPPQTLVIPNPVSAERMPPAESDPHRLPSYTADLKTKRDLTFVQLSDSQFDDGTVASTAGRYKYAPQMSEVAMQQVNRLNPPLVFMTGDLTNKSTPAEWQTFHRIYSQLKPPFYAMPGNHDLLDERELLADEKALGDFLQVARENWAAADRAAGKKTDDRLALYRHYVRPEPHFTVEKNGCVFLCLNTWKASVDREQMVWLREELERTKDAPHVFVMGHYPVLPVFGGNVAGPEGQEILQLLREYKVAGYLSGHRHRYDYRMHEGTAHILCDDLCWGEYVAYQIYHVYPDRFVACWKPLFRADGNRPLYERVTFPEPRYRGEE